MKTKHDVLREKFTFGINLAIQRMIERSKKLDENIVISKDNKIRQTIKYGDYHLLAAIEFKLLHKPLGQAIKDEIKKEKL